MNTVDLERAVVDALAHRADRTTVHAGVAFDGRSATSRQRPRWQAPAVAAAAAAVVAAGLVAAGSRNDGASGDTTVPTTPAVFAAPDDGRLTLPAELGFQGWRAGDMALNHGRWGLQRIYTTSAARPETAQTIVLEVTPGSADDMEMNLDPDALDVTLRGTEAHYLPAEGRVTVDLVEDGFRYRFTGWNMGPEAVFEVIERADLRGLDSPAFEPGSLPNGASEQSAGYPFEAWFLSEQALATFIPTATFDEVAGDRYVWYLSAADPDLVRLNRLAFDFVKDVTINDQPGFVGTVTSQVGHRTIMWSTGTRTVMLGGNGYRESELVAIAEALRPASDGEWGPMTSQTGPDVTYEEPASTQLIATESP